MKAKASLHSGFSSFILQRGKPPSKSLSLSALKTKPAAQMFNRTACSDEFSTVRQLEMDFEGSLNFTGDGSKRKRSRSSPKKESTEKSRKRSCCKKIRASSKKAGKNRDSSFIQEGVKKRTVLSRLIDLGLLKEHETVCYLSRKDGHVRKEGQVTREGVLCKCCKDVFGLSEFEVHAGSKLHRPSANMFLDDGRSISACQLQACYLQDAAEKKVAATDDSDDTCGVCGDGGELLICDRCPSTFHADCIGLEVIPEGDWYCSRCCCGVCGANQLDGDADKALLRCDQCELHYHPACVRLCGMLRPQPYSRRKNWFCSHRCEKIFTDLRGLVGIANPIEDGISWTLLRPMKEDQGITSPDLEVMDEHINKLCVAHGVMQECFVPMVDPRTNIDLISQALYSRRSNVSRLNCFGFYTLLLEREDELLCVATIRVHGSKVAEMPLVGTRHQYRRQGMCLRLMHALEKMLKKIGVEKLIIPAVPELLETWMGAFNFQHMSTSERHELLKINLMSFPGTTLLQKHLTN